MFIGPGRALLLASVLVLPAAAQASPASFDGSWSVTARPERGDCSRPYQLSFGVRNGALVYGPSGVQASGRVAGNGALRGVLAYAGAQASVSGRLSSRGRGQGRWTSSGTLTCSGRWSAQRTS